MQHVPGFCAELALDLEKVGNGNSASSGHSSLSVRSADPPRGALQSQARVIGMLYVSAWRIYDTIQYVFAGSRLDHRRAEVCWVTTNLNLIVEHTQQRYTSAGLFGNTEQLP
jgi:hypothetical protein